MGQITAKTVLDVLQWIETTPHTSAAWRTKDGRNYAGPNDQDAHLVLKGGREILRIPLAVQVKTRHLVVSNRDPFDNRMFRANAAGKLRLRRQKAKATSKDPVS